MFDRKHSRVNYYKGYRKQKIIGDITIDISKNTDDCIFCLLLPFTFSYNMMKKFCHK
jgi:hypothetical protein